MNEDQKALFKEREISGFIDLANEHDFDVTQSVRNHETTLLSVEDKKKELNCILQIKLVKMFGNGIPEKPFDLYNMDKYETGSDFDRLTLLLKQSNQLIVRLRENTMNVKPEVEDKTMTLKVFLTDDSIVTIHDMSAEDFRQLIAQSTDWVSLDNMTVSVWDKGKGCININKIVTFVGQKDEEGKK